MSMKQSLLSARGFALLLAAHCAWLGLCFTQTTFERTYSGYEGQAVQQTSDGGYIIAGRAPSYDASTSNAYLVKTNPSGDTIWTKRYGRGRWDGGYSVKQTSDGGYIITGTTVSFEASGSNVFLFKTNASGDTLWTRVYGGPYDDWGYSVQQTSDGGYIVAGYTSSSQDYYKNDAYLIKTNASGDTIWTRTYGGADIDQAYSVGLTSDGGYIVAGSTRSYDAGREHVYLVRTNATGDTLWTRVYAEGAGRCVEQTSDGGYIIAGYPSLVKTDSIGVLLWQRAYPSFVGSEHAFVHQTPSDGGYILVGSKYEWPTGTDLRLVKADAQGDTLWTRTYGGPDYEDGNSVQQTSDGGYIIAGTTYSNSAASSEVYLIKTGVDGFVDVPSPLTLATPADGVKGQPTSPTLSWNMSQRATSYRLQVAMEPSFTELILDDSSLAKTSSAVSDLLNYTRYYWRAKGENQYGGGQYSHVWSFTTIVAAPLLQSPVDGAINQATTLALVWRASAGATYYRVQVGADSTFKSGLFLDDSTLVDTARLVSGLAPGTRYYWHVNAMGTGGTSVYSPVWSFETEGQIAHSQWTQTATPSDCRVHALAACGKNIIAMTSSPTDDGNILVTTDSGSSWKSVLNWPAVQGAGGGPLSLAGLGADAFVGYAVAPEGGAPGAVRVSSDSGLTWGTTIGSGTIHWPTTMAFNGSSLFIGYVLQGMASFRKNASDWTYTSITPPSDHEVRALAIIESMVLAATKEEGLFLSTNQGQTWDSINDGLATLSINSIVGIGSTLFVGTSVGVYSSTNNGSSWSPANSGLTNRNISSFAASEGFLFAGTDSGAFLTSDSGKNWIPANQGLASKISALAIGRYLFAGTSSGVWRWPLSGLIVSVGQQSARRVPREFTLEQNYPNPFNPSTVIKYTVGGTRDCQPASARPDDRPVGRGLAGGPEVTHVSLVVYDVLGRQVAVLVNEKKTPRTYEVHFDGSGLPSGVYFCRMVAGDFCQTRKLLLLK
jgi:hypothetical protein